MAQAKKPAAKKAAPKKPTAEKTSPQVEDQKAKSTIPPELDEPQCESKPTYPEDPFIAQALNDLFRSKTKDQELSKKERILRILNGSSPYETREILEDVEIAIKRRVEDNIREQERNLGLLRRESQYY